MGISSLIICFFVCFFFTPFTLPQSHHLSIVCILLHCLIIILNTIGCVINDQSTPVGSIQTGHEVVVSPNRDRHTGTNKVSNQFHFCFSDVLISHKLISFHFVLVLSLGYCVLFYLLLFMSLIQLSLIVVMEFHAKFSRALFFLFKIKTLNKNQRVHDFQKENWMQSKKNVISKCQLFFSFSIDASS